MKRFVAIVTVLCLVSPTFAKPPHHNPPHHNPPHHNPPHHGNHHGNHHAGNHHKGHAYRHHCLGRDWNGFTHRRFHRDLGWLYWSPDESVWYQQDAEDGIFTPCDDLVTEDAVEGEDQ